MMSDDKPAPRSVIATVEKLVQDHFGTHPPTPPSSLPTFNASEEGVLGNLWRNDIDVPVDPIKRKHSAGWAQGNWPSLLLFDLEKKGLEESNVYKHIVSQQDLGPTYLYGTSGAGKTRAVFEYLSRNKGFYFLAGDFERNPGSQDLARLFQQVSDLRAVPNTEAGTAYSSANLDTILFRFRVMLYIRHTVHGFLEEKLGRSVSAWEWLMFQLFPDELMGDDIFHSVLDVCIDLRLITAETSNIARKEINYWWSIFVDESQRLLGTEDGFFLSQDGLSKRSNFSALMKAIYSDTEKKYHVKMKFPVFSGTGYSLDGLKKETSSASAKNPSYSAEMETYKEYFTGFELLDAAKVENYIRNFLDLTDIDPDVIKHVTRWLRGRPRWTATFLEAYVMRKRVSETEGRTRVRGDISDKARDMLEALDRFLSVMTCDQKTANRRASWNAGPTSAYSSISHLMMLRTQEAQLAQRDLKRAVFQFAVGKRKTIIRGDPSKRLIEAGVVAVRVQDTEGSVVAAFLDEPIVVQAGINYFCLGTYLRDQLTAQEEHGQGQAFERVLLPILLQDENTRLRDCFQQQLMEHGATELKKFHVSIKSSYGVLTLDTGNTSKDSMEASIDWISGAVHSKIEGQVPPFCYPDSNIGPDVIYLMWNEKYTDFRACLVQSKYEKYSNQLDALRTLVPDWLYHKHRDAPSKRTLALSGDLANRWNDVKDYLVSDKRPCLRLLVQFPAKLPKAAAPGQVAPDGTGPTDENATKKKRDWFVTISDKNLHMFDKQTEDIIRLLKRPRTN